MFIFLTIIHVIICLFLVVAVLLQSGKGGGLAASVGGGLGSSSVLGGRAASTFLTKATTVLATAFMVSCLLLSLTFDTGDEPTTAIERTMTEAPAEVPTPFSTGGDEGGGLIPATDEGAEAPATTTEEGAAEEGAGEAAPAAETQTGE